MKFSPVVKEVSSLGFSFDEFLEFFRGLVSDAKEELICLVLEEFGPRSKEFVFVVQGFVFWLVNRYVGDWVLEEDVSDLFYECLAKVLEFVVLYQREKGKLMSFLYSLVRDTITKFLYRLRKGGIVESMELQEGRDVWVGRDIIEEMIVGRIKERVMWGYVGETVYWRKWVWDVYKEVISGGDEGKGS